MDALSKLRLTRQELLERAQSLVGVLRKRALRTNAERKLPPESMADLRAAGLLNVLLPTALGGLEMGYSVFSAITRTLATGCGSTAWVYAILTEAAWIAALYPKQAQAEVWEDPNVLVCVSIVPFGKASKVEGGYRLSGRWPFLSGSDYATWVVLNANLFTQSGSAEQIASLVRVSELRIIDDWQVMGLAGTGSKTGIAEDVFVPNWRAVPWAAFLNGTTPGRDVYPNYVLGRAPRDFVAAFSLSPVSVGLASRAVELGADIVRMQSAAPATPDWVAVQSRFAEAAVDIDLANLVLSTYGPRNDEVLRSGGTITEQDIALMRLRGARLVRLSKHAIEQIIAVSGSKFLYDSNPLQIILRDALAAASHRGVNWELVSMTYCNSLRAGRADTKLG
jgi:alkylation response protein AidB-like acyl-CoA dehydrogenase